MYRIVWLYRLSKITGLVALVLLSASCAYGAAKPTQQESAALRQARQRLALAEATAARIARERVVLQNRATLAPDVTADLEVYQRSVEKMVVGQRRKVAEMEASLAAAATPSLIATPKINVLPGEYDEPKSRAQKLEDEFGESLSAFDEFLLVEIEEADNAAAEGSDAAEMTELAREAAEAAERLKERGIDVAGNSGEKGGEEGDGSEGAEAGEAGEGEPGQQPGGENSQPGQDVAGNPAGDKAPAGNDQQPVAGGGEKPPPGNGGAPPGTPPPGDDDIVARQLREAAERETDPVLREKLWREYRNYKEGSSRDK